MTSKKRPIFLELWRIDLPMAGFVSILHRISGLLMVLAIPVSAQVLHQGLSGAEGFSAAAAFLGHPLVGLGLLVILWSLLHHLFAGIRYLAMDLGWGLDRGPARSSAWVVLISALAATMLVIALVWGAGA